MGKNKFIFIVLILLLNLKAYTQVGVKLPDSLYLKTIEELHEKTRRNSYSLSLIIDSLQYLECKELELKLDLLMGAANYINYLNKYNLGKYYLQNNQKIKAANLFKEILRFEFWGKYHNVRVGENKMDEAYFNVFYDLYWKAGRLLIKCYEGNLKKLHNLHFVGSTHRYLLPQLKRAILRAGGVWNRGSTEFGLPANDVKRIQKQREQYEKY